VLTSNFFFTCGTVHKEPAAHAFPGVVVGAVVCSITKVLESIVLLEFWHVPTRAREESDEIP
jgi:hypothetical protein